MEAEDDNDEELTLLNSSTDSLSLNVDTEEGDSNRPRLIINIMSGSNDNKSVVIGHDEIEPGEEHDKFHDVPSQAPIAATNVVLRHPRVPPLHGTTIKIKT